MTDLVFLYGDKTSKVLVVLVDLRSLLSHLGQLGLDRHVLRDGSFRRVDHRPVRRPAELVGRLVYALYHLLLHSTGCTNLNTHVINLQHLGNRSKYYREVNNRYTFYTSSKMP